MAGKPVHTADTQTMRDVRTLLSRGLTKGQVAQQLGMSRATLYRLLERAR